ncbi:MAG: glycosyltransferase family 4 protein [Planctomycetes bacterium]|nr:glycosyltransferase family 4 protein [Planctomycetota bacterium]
MSESSREALEARADALDPMPDANEPAPAPASVEFLGWLPVFKRFGNCGAHPQFAHTDAPPPGYRFVRSAPESLADELPSSLLTKVGRALGAVVLSLGMMADTARRQGVLRTFGTLWAFSRFVLALIRKTRRVLPSLRFAHSRHFQSQVLAPRAELAFLTSVPYTYGQNPWVIEIEDPTTLFHPFIENGRTAALDVRASPYFAAVKALLEANTCRGIITHMRSTAELLPALFQSEIVARKVTYAPLGAALPTDWQTHDEDGPVNLLFTNSWHQRPDNFFLRGGLDVLEAFDVLRRRYPQLRLTIRASLPVLERRYQRMLLDGWVRVIDRFLPNELMAELQRESHIFLLPAARIHIVSVLQAMSYGQVVVASDGWGMQEYIGHGRNGLIVPGRAGKVTWADRAAGMLREDYAPMYTSDKKVVNGLIESVSLLVERRAVRRRIGHAARADVRTRFTLDQWNAALAAAFDKARRGG